MCPVEFDKCKTKADLQGYLQNKLILLEADIQKKLCDPARAGGGEITKVVQRFLDDYRNELEELQRTLEALEGNPEDHICRAWQEKIDTLCGTWVQKVGELHTAIMQKKGGHQLNDAGPGNGGDGPAGEEGAERALTNEERVNEILADIRDELLRQIEEAYNNLTQTVGRLGAEQRQTNTHTLTNAKKEFVALQKQFEESFLAYSKKIQKTIPKGEALSEDNFDPRSFIGNWSSEINRVQDSYIKLVEEEAARLRTEKEGPAGDRDRKKDSAERAADSPRLAIFCDFDGTLTKHNGQTCVDRARAKGFSFTAQGMEAYANSLSEAEAKAEFVDGAIDFIRAALARHPRVAFHMVTNNHQDYIKILLRKAGVSRDEIDRIQFHDREKRQKEEKGVTLEKHALTGEDRYNLCLDNSLTDIGSYKKSAEKMRSEGKPDNVKPVHFPAGGCQFRRWTQFMNQLCSPSQDNGEKARLRGHHPQPEVQAGIVEPQPQRAAGLAQVAAPAAGALSAQPQRRQQQPPQPAGAAGGGQPQPQQPQKRQQEQSAAQQEKLNQILAQLCPFVRWHGADKGNPRVQSATGFTDWDQVRARLKEPCEQALGVEFEDKGNGHYTLGDGIVQFWAVRKGNGGVDVKFEIQGDLEVVTKRISDIKPHHVKKVKDLLTRLCPNVTWDKAQKSNPFVQDANGFTDINDVRARLIEPCERALGVTFEDKGNGHYYATDGSVRFSVSKNSNGGFNVEFEITGGLDKVTKTANDVRPQAAAPAAGAPPAQQPQQQPQQPAPVQANGAGAGHSRPPQPQTPNEGDFRYSLGNPLGEGTYGKVYKGQYYAGGRWIDVAVKIPTEAHNQALQQTPGFDRQVNREDKIARDHNHPNLIKGLGFRTAKDDKTGKTCTVQLFEYASEGSLLKRMTEFRSKPESTKLNILQGVFEGVADLHKRGIVHRDLKPDNILLDTGQGDLWIPKVCDFGLAMDTNTATRQTKGQDTGTRPYASPEQIARQGVDHKSDAWALGILLYEVYVGVRPTAQMGFEPGPEAPLMVAIADGRVSSFIQNQLRSLTQQKRIPTEVARIISALTTQNPMQRMSVQEASNALGLLRQPQQPAPVQANGAGAGGPPQPQPPNEGDFTYDKNRILGKGGFGVVYKGQYFTQGKWVEVAVKFPTQAHLELLRNSESFRRKQEREVKIALSTNHPNLVKGYGQRTATDFHTKEQHEVMIFEYAGEGSLRDRLKEFFLQKDSVKLGIVLGICEGVGSLHQKGYFHRDLKPDNVLLTKDHNGSMIPKVCDFGLAVEQQAASRQTLACADGTPHYQSPEQLSGNPHGPEVDAWALGIMFYELIVGENPSTPFLKRGNSYLAIAIVNGDVSGVIRQRISALIYAGKINPAVGSIILGLTQLKASERWTVPQATAELKRILPLIYQQEQQPQPQQQPQPKPQPQPPGQQERGALGYGAGPYGAGGYGVGPGRVPGGRGGAPIGQPQPPRRGGAGAPPRPQNPYGPGGAGYGGYGAPGRGDGFGMPPQPQQGPARQQQGRGVLVFGGAGNGGRDHRFIGSLAPFVIPPGRGQQWPLQLLNDKCQERESRRAITAALIQSAKKADRANDPRYRAMVRNRNSVRIYLDHETFRNGASKQQMLRALGIYSGSGGRGDKNLQMMEALGIDKNAARSALSDGGTTDNRHKNRHRMVYSMTTFYRTQADQQRQHKISSQIDVRVVSGSAPNLRSSNDDIRRFVNVDGSLKNPEEYQEELYNFFRRSLSILDQQGAELVTLPLVGGGVYLGKLTAPGAKEAARRHIHLALRRAMETSQFENIQNVVYSLPDQSVNGANQQNGEWNAASDVFKDYKGKAKLTLTSADCREVAMKAKESGIESGLINAGADNSIGGEVFEQLDNSSGKKPFAPVEELLSGSSDLVFTQGLLNPALGRLAQLRPDELERDPSLGGVAQSFDQVLAKTSPQPPAADAVHRGYGGKGKEKAPADQGGPAGRRDKGESQQPPAADAVHRRDGSKGKEKAPADPMPHYRGGSDEDRRPQPQDRRVSPPAGPGGPAGSSSSSGSSDGGQQQAGQGAGNGGGEKNNLAALRAELNKRILKLSSSKDVTAEQLREAEARQQELVGILDGIVKQPVVDFGAHTAVVFLNKALEAKIQEIKKKTPAAAAVAPSQPHDAAYNRETDIMSLIKRRWPNCSPDKIEEVDNIDKSVRGKVYKISFCQKGSNEQSITKPANLFANDLMSLDIKSEKTGKRKDVVVTGKGGSTISSLFFTPITEEVSVFLKPKEMQTLINKIGVEGQTYTACSQDFKCEQQGAAAQLHM